MDGLLAFLIITMLGGFMLFMVALCGGFSGVEHDISEAPNHSYTEQEFVDLYNYCIRKRNALLPKVNGFSTMSVDAQKLRKIDIILNSVWDDYESPYKQPNYTQLCRKLLTLLKSSEQKEINYGIHLNH